MPAETDNEATKQARIFEAAIQDIQIPRPNTGQKYGYTVVLSTGSSKQDYNHAVSLAKQLAGNGAKNEVNATPAEGDNAACVSVFINGVGGANAIRDLSSKTGVYTGDLVGKLKVKPSPGLCSIDMIRALDTEIGKTKKAAKSV